MEKLEALDAPHAVRMPFGKTRGSIGAKGGKPFILALLFLTFAPALRCAGQPLATVTVNAQKLGTQIPKDFLGFSNEVTVIGQGLPKSTAKALGARPNPSDIPARAKPVYVLGLPGQPNNDFFQFMRNLGPGILRLGGNSQDRTCWDPKTAPHPEWCQGPITPGDLKLYSTAVGAAGWRMILGLNLKQDSPSWALSEVSEGIAKEIPVSQIFALETGNEPTNYGSTPTRPRSYSPQDYVRDALGYIRAFRANSVAQQYSYAGASDIYTPQTLSIVLKGLSPYLRLVSIHHYTTTTCGQRNVTVEHLLSPKREERFNKLSQQLVVVAHQYGLPTGLMETSSASCGGMEGVSDAFASAVWGLDYLFNDAQDGYVHVDFHISYRHGASAYNPIQVFGWRTRHHQEQYRNIAQPLYYAMYMFAQHASGERLLPTSIKTAGHITAFATSSCPTCEAHAFVINKDETAHGQVRVHLTGRAGSASLLLLRAPSLHSLAGNVRYGGRQFDTRGHIAPPHTTRVRRNAQGDYVFTLPKASAAVLSIAR